MWVGGSKKNLGKKNVSYEEIFPKKSLAIAAGRPGSSEVPRNPLTHWDVSSTPANGIFLAKKLKNKNKYKQINK